MARLKYDLATVLSLVEGPGDAPASRWLHEGAGSIADLEPRDAASAIEAAVRLKRADRIAAARDEASTKAVRKAAAAAAHKLKSAGIDVPDTARGQQWSLGAEQVEVVPPVTLMGMPDPDGWLPFVVVSYGPQDTVAFAGLAGAGFGHRDTHHSHLGRSDAKSLVHDARRGHDLHELPPHVAIHLLERAFDEGNSAPHEWEHFSDLVGAGVLTSARVLDPFRALPTELDEAALRDVEPILDARHQLVFGLNEEMGQKAMARIVGALASPLEVNDASRTRRLKQDLDEVADEALDEAARRAWSFAMDVVSLLAQGRGDEALSRSARHTALALRAGHAGRDVPFVRASVERQLATVTEAYTQMVQQRAAAAEQVSAQQDGAQQDSALQADADGPSAGA